MRKLYAILFCLLIAVPALAQSEYPRERWGETAPTSALPTYLKSWDTDWVNPHAVYYFNGYGDTLNVGDVVLFKPKVLVDSMVRASAADTLTIADSLDNFYWSQVRVKSLNSTSACTCVVVGLDTALVVQRDSFVMATGAAGVKFSQYYWRKINLVIIRNGASLDSSVVYGVPVATVYGAASAANAAVVGVVAKKSNPDTYVKVYVSGICQAKLIGATTEVVAGGYLETSATALYGQYNATPATGKRLGRALESGVTDGLYWINCNP